MSACRRELANAHSRQEHLTCVQEPALQNRQVCAAHGLKGSIPSPLRLEPLAGPADGAGPPQYPALGRRPDPPLAVVPVARSPPPRPPAPFLPPRPAPLP